MTDKTSKIEALTKDEINGLDAAAAQRLLGEIDSAISDLYIDLAQVAEELGNAKTKYTILKTKKDLLSSRARILKDFIRST